MTALSALADRCLARGRLPLYMAFLAFMTLACVAVWLHGIAAGEPLGGDFTAFYATAKLVLAGRSAWAYDPAHAFPLQRALTAPHPVQLLWSYPPPASLVLWPLALTSLPVAFSACSLAGLAAFGATVRRVTGSWRAAALSLTAPAATLCVLDGQTGLLIAAAFGGGMALLDRRPLSAGLLLSLLVLKPHLLPVAVCFLLVAGRWRTLVGLGSGALALTAASLLVLGPADWIAWPGALARAAQGLSQGSLPLSKVPSAYAAALELGAPYAVAMGLHLLVLAAALALCGAIWIGGADADAKVSAAAVGSVMLSPYVFDYDLTLLVVAAAFLLRRRPWERMSVFRRAVVAALFILPTLGTTLAQAAHLQATPFALLGLLALLAAEAEAWAGVRLRWRWRRAPWRDAGSVGKLGPA